MGFGSNSESKLFKMQYFYCSKTLVSFEDKVFISVKWNMENDIIILKYSLKYNWYDLELVVELMWKEIRVKG